MRREGDRDRDRDGDRGQGTGAGDRAVTSWNVISCKNHLFIPTG